MHAGQRPKLERYGEVLFLVVRSARYIDESEEVEFSEFHILVRGRAVAVLCQDHRWIDGTDGTANIVDTDGGGALASTGVQVGALVGTAVLLVASGCWFVVVTRRRAEGEGRI